MFICSSFNNMSLRIFTLIFFFSSALCQLNSGNTFPWWLFTTTRNQPPTTTPFFFEPTTTFRPTTTTTLAPPLVDATVLAKPNCFAQPECISNFEHKYAFLEGVCNNPIDKNRGRAGRLFKRLLPPDYGDKLDTPRLDKNGIELPSARKISLALNLGEQTKSNSISHMMPWWGQFITHEITRTPKGRESSGATFDCNCDTPDKEGCINIPYEKTDAHFTQNADTCMELERSEVIPDPECDTSVREIKNGVTSFIDAGIVYGDSQDDLEKLLDSKSSIGELLVGEYAEKGTGAGLPFQTQVLREFGARMRCEVMVHKPPNKPCMLAGDTRANENTGLSALQVVFLRLHNKIVADLNNINLHWSKNTLVKETKAIVAAIMQQITYDEFLPVILGEKYMERFNLKLAKQGFWLGYDASVDAGLSHAFSAAAFRFGHTVVRKEMSRPAPDWHTNEARPLPVKDIFFNNEPLLEQFHGGVNSVLRGLMKDAAQLSGVKMIPAMSEFLFAMPGRLGDDLFATNTQRGRDHGVPGYNQFREICGMKKADSFFDIPEIPNETLQRLAKLYKHVDDIDLYIGGLSEIAVSGGAVGPLFACIIGYQFRDLRKGDKFWFENGGEFSLFTRGQLDSIRKYSFSRLMCDTMNDMRTIQPKPMLLSSLQGNERKFCDEYPTLDLQEWRDSIPKNKEKRMKQDTMWSPWIPCQSNGNIMSVATTLNDALAFRPSDVCREVIASETRDINSLTQVRFECPVGSIVGSDFPYIDSGYEVFWTTWKDNSSPNNNAGDDIEEEPSKRECQRPLYIQAQTSTGIPARETGDVFESFGTTHGLVCRGNHQMSRKCNNYRVRYLCRRTNIKRKSHSPVKMNQPDNKKKTDPNELVWTPWSNTGRLTFEGDKELLSAVRNVPGFCKNPIFIDARTVNTKLQARSSGNVFDEFTRNVGLICLNSNQLNQCHDFEVRYLCRNADINEDASVPESITLQTKEFCKFYGVCC